MKVACNGNVAGVWLTNQILVANEKAPVLYNMQMH